MQVVTVYQNRLHGTLDRARVNNHSKMLRYPGFCLSGESGRFFRVEVFKRCGSYMRVITVYQNRLHSTLGRARVKNQSKMLRYPGSCLSGESCRFFRVDVHKRNSKRKVDKPIYITEIVFSSAFRKSTFQRHRMKLKNDLVTRRQHFGFPSSVG